MPKKNGQNIHDDLGNPEDYLENREDNTVGDGEAFPFIAVKSGDQKAITEKPPLKNNEGSGKKRHKIRSTFFQRR